MNSLRSGLWRAALSLTVAAAFVSATPANAQNAPTPAAAADSDIDIDETAQAELLWRFGNVTAALPVYERLATKTPQSALIAERYAYCLMTKALLLPAGDERGATLAQAKKEAERAQSLGDQSALLAVVLEAAAHPEAAKHQFEARMAKAEAAFAKGDLDTALAAYQEIVATDPTSYEARLFSGDVYFRRGDAQLAGEWFQKAIDLQPNREIAYRYWGDALEHAGRHEEALPKFIDAVVAEPYSRTAWMGLSQWAKFNRVTIKAPHIEVPPAPTLEGDKNGDGKPDVVIHVTPQNLNTQDGSAVWLAYTMTRAAWLTNMFYERFPDEKKYRHTLAEEVSALGVAAEMLEKAKAGEKGLEDNLRTLALLGKTGMLEPYVLVSAADEGIAQDYDAYRDAHRDAVRTYIKEQVLHREEAKK